LPGGALKFIERWNFFAALLILAVLLSLFSPIADPARIAVNSQLARLQSGAVTAANFDFSYLGNGGLRFGREALDRLALSTDGATRAAARNAKNSIVTGSRLPIQGRPPITFAASITVFPKGKALPQSFVKQDWSQAARGSFVPRCDARGGAVKITCEALVADLDGDGKEDVLLLSEIGEKPSYYGYLFQQSPEGLWEYRASLGYPHCDGDLEALRAGRLNLVPAMRADAIVGGRRVAMNWQRSSLYENCPAAPARPPKSTR
jgi:hypothetical protein